MSQPARKFTPAKPAKITILDPFSYDNLKPDEADYLRSAAANINARRALSHRLTVEIGQILIEAKERMPGVFLAWVETEFDFSADTAENYMLTARNLPELANPEKYQMRAIYQLARTGTPQEAIDAAAEKAGAGQKVDYETSFILANAPEPIRQRYLAETLTKPQAFALAKALTNRRLPPVVKTDCLTHNVSNAAVVEYLADCWHRQQATARHAQPSKTYNEIAGDNWSLNGIGWSVPVSDATAQDVDRYKVDRQNMHIAQGMEKYDWLRFEAVVIYNANGDPFLSPVGVKLPPGIKGETVLVDMRIKRDENKKSK
jgi:hypothetical protein